MKVSIHLPDHLVEWLASKSIWKDMGPTPLEIGWIAQRQLQVAYETEQLLYVPPVEDMTDEELAYYTCYLRDAKNIYEAWRRTQDTLRR